MHIISTVTERRCRVSLLAALCGLVVALSASALVAQPPTPPPSQQPATEEADANSLPLDQVEGPLPGEFQQTTPNIASQFGKPITSINIDFRDHDPTQPADRSGEMFDKFASPAYPPARVPLVATWCAPNIVYQPLYFEDVALERYGQAHGDLIQPVCSTVHFTGSFALLPLNLWRDPPASCVTPLGYCRPGSPQDCCYGEVR